MKEINRANWECIIEQSIHKPFFLYLETPLCGTCKVGKRMTEVAVETVRAQRGTELPYGVCNINEMPELAEQYGVTSVPCLMVLSRGMAVKKIYALQSAGNIYQTMIDFLNKEK
ncbi:thioredoxin family protein [Fictibacillus phosphorivorans]|uniref:thioredoxin family protein n=1 Tax=Fictibacillus phosphorivorans TaxID=1221500 RepID=UPI00204261FD|nr:thioredoxin family protein [Fictibacillus phosphorivorans]MCM3718826.1 thioredoxin family protein [Fictibacillus phosphorivorans]MCM3776448.1 thioredoxin family protein [Fictibacillus phosphorivorans]